MNDFPRMKRLPPYVFSVMDDLKSQIIKTGAPIFDFGMGNPDQPTPPHIVEALRSACSDPALHRYAPTKGILPLREAIVDWYKRRFQVELNPDTEAFVTIGSKEGLAHLALATVEAGDTVLVPNPCYPVHHYGFVLADADVLNIPLLPHIDFIAALEETIQKAWPKPKILMLNFPANPTTQCVDLEFFTKIIALAHQHQIWVVHDLAYADIVFDGYKAPSILEVPGAKDIAVESYTLSKSYNMAGWRVGFMCGNSTLINALARLKSYLDYGSFGAIQMAAVAALQGPDDCIRDNCNLYQSRRDQLCAGLQAVGWNVEIPKATMFVWAEIPEPYRHLGSLEFAKLLLREANIVVSPGIGFGEYGNHYVRFSLIENEARVQEALTSLQQFFHGEFQVPANSSEPAAL
jgi:alanine-synthesizing transaminase